MAQIKLTKLTKVINGTVLFTAPTLVASGSDVVGVIGRNGAGKTTLMKIIAGQDHDFSGQRVVSGSYNWLSRSMNLITIAVVVRKRWPTSGWR